MCLVCNPYCGRCRPPAKKAVRCPNCSSDTSFTRDECLRYLGYLKSDKGKENLKQCSDVPRCKVCGTDLRAELAKKTVPQTCLYRGIVCGYPCGRYRFPKRVGDLDCAKPLPLRKLSSEEWNELTTKEEVIRRRGAM